MLSTLLFTWFQGANFYAALHEYALTRLPEAVTGTWLEVGCGPGLWSRLAARRGFRVTGIDSNRLSITVARALALSLKKRVRFQVGRLETLGSYTANVVAASSLLAVLPDRKKGLLQLWERVEHGGYLIVIEPTARLTGAKVKALLAQGKLPPGRLHGLKLWAAARQGRTVPDNDFEPLDEYLHSYDEALEGLVAIRLFRKT